MASDIKIESVLVPVPTELNTPPGSPGDGEQHVVGSSPTGAYSGHAGEVATYSSGSGWSFGSTWDVALSFDPKGLVCSAVRATALDTVSSGQSIAFGACDGTNQGGSWCGSTDGADPSSCGRQTVTAYMLDIDVGALQIDAVSAGPSTGVWQFTIATASTDQYYIRFDFFGGADFNCALSFHDNPSGGTFSKTGLSWQPKALWCVSSRHTTTSVTSSSMLTVGFAYDTGAGTTQGCVVAYGRSGQSAGGWHNLRIAADCCNAEAAYNGASLTGKTTITAWNSDGYDGAQADSSADDLLVFAIDTGDRAVWSSFVSTPTSTGDQSYTGPSFPPQYVGGVMTGIESSPEAGGNDTTTGMYGFFGGGLSVSVHEEEDADPTNSDGYATESIALIDYDGAALQVAISAEELTASGWDWTFSAVNGSATYWLAWAIEAAAASGRTATIGETLPALSESLTGETLVAGAASETLPAFSEVLEGETLVAGAASETLPAFSETTFEGEVLVAGTLGETLPAFSESSGGDVGIAGTIGETLPAFSESLEGDVLVAGAAGETLPAFSESALGEVLDAGTIGETLPAFSESLEGETLVAGAASETLPAFSETTFEGEVLVEGTIGEALPAFSEVVLGGGVAGTIGETLPAFSESLEGDVLVAGAAGETLPAFSESAFGEVLVEGTAAEALPAFSESLAGETLVEGTIGETLPAFVESASGSENPDRTGTIGETLPAFSEVLEGEVLVAGAASETLPAFSELFGATTTVVGSVEFTLAPIATVVLTDEPLATVELELVAAASVLLTLTPVD